MTKTKSSLCVLSFALFGASLAPSARADDQKPDANPAAPAPGDSPKRAMPDYDGLPQRTTPGDVALWVPKVVFFPAWVVTEYVVRKPLGAFTEFVDEHQVISALSDFFTFGPNHNIGIVPTGLIDFGFRSSVGVYSFWDDFLAKDNDLRLHAATGGGDWLRATIADSVKLDERSHLRFRFEIGTRPDWPFYGLGPHALETNRARYKADSITGGMVLHAGLTDGATLRVVTNVRSENFNPEGDCCHDPSLAQRAAAGELALPPGFDGYTALMQQLTFSIDSRKPRPAPGTGVRLELDAAYDVDLRRPADRRWVKYGGTLGGFLDLTGQQRVLSLSIHTEMVDPVGDTDEIPFTELASIGGFETMRGFLYNRAFDRSAAVATLEYRYPIWALLDGTLQFSMGNVFGKHLEDFSPKLFRMSWDGGIKTAGERDHALSILFGAGTETFEDGARVNSLRFVFGATRSF